MARAPKASTTKPSPPRRRRNADEARAAILDAAEARLVEAGPSGIRLQEVAADVGVSHPTVLHHFGSREALVEAVVGRAFDSLHARVLEAVRNVPEGEENLANLLDGIFDALVSQGQARAVMWLALAGYGPGRKGLRLEDLAKVVHEVRCSRKKGKKPTLEDSSFTVLLASLALLAQSVIGPQLVRDLGLDDDARTHRRFRAWLARLMIEHFESD